MKAPTNSQVTINYSLAKSTDTQVFVYNINGQQVWISEKIYQDPGNYSIPLSLESEIIYHSPSGVYFFSLQTEDGIYTKKFILLN